MKMSASPETSGQAGRIRLLRGAAVLGRSNVRQFEGLGSIRTNGHLEIAAPETAHCLLPKAVGPRTAMSAWSELRPFEDITRLLFELAGSAARAPRFG